VVGAAAYITRGNVDAAGIGVGELRTLLELRIPSWPAASCTLCAQGVPVNTRYAHGAEFVAAR
jgi:orotate phosphoribosyltransferase